MVTDNWSNLAKIVYKRTYSREMGDSNLENWEDTVKRVIDGNIKKYRGTEFLEDLEEERLNYFLLNRKATPAGRGLWLSGTESHEMLGAGGLTNCYTLSSENWEHFPVAADLLMLGGGVGMTVEHKYTSKLPRIKRGVSIVNKETADADFIVPDSRQGWVSLIRKILRSFFETGESFSYSCIVVRGAGEPIRGFGGKASGKLPLINFATKLSTLLTEKEGKKLHPIDAADILCLIGELVVSGNVRRSALMIQGDPFDKEFLKAKRWDLGQIPTQRAMANFSVNCSDIDDLHPLFWKTYEHGEPFGIVNIPLANKYGRIGEEKRDYAIVANPCAEQIMENGGACVTYDTMLITRDSINKIGDLVGKEVEVWNGEEWSKVVPVKTGENKDIYRVSFSDGSYLDCTDNHKFLAGTRFEKVKEYTTKQLEEKLRDCKYSIRVPRAGIVDYNFGSPLTYAYEYGLLAGDGYIEYKNTKAYPKVVLIGKKQEISVENYTNKSPVQYEYKYKGGATTYTLQNLDVEICQTIKNTDTGLPKPVMSADRDSILKFFAGWIDTDGSIAGNGVRVYGSEQNIRDGQLLLTKCGIISSVNLMSRKGEVTNYGTRNRDIWYLQIPVSDDIPTQRVKTNRGNKITGKGKYQQVVSVQKLGIKADSYCFTEHKLHQGVFNNVLTKQCNLVELFLPNLESIEEFKEAARLMYRWAKRVTLEGYHQPLMQSAVEKTHRVGVGITGCLQSELFTPDILDSVYREIQEEDKKYSKLLGVKESIRLTTCKPSGTISIVGDVTPGLHPAFSKYYIRRVRFSANDKLVNALRNAGHKIEPVKRLDGTLDHETLVVDFPCVTKEGTPVADDGWDTWKQLEIVKMVGKHWTDSSASVTVYYKKEEIPQLKSWLRDNLQEIKSISFLCHNDHGFSQAPYEAISEAEYNDMVKLISPINMELIGKSEKELESMECEGGACPIK